MDDVVVGEEKVLTLGDQVDLLRIYSNRITNLAISDPNHENENTERKMLDLADEALSTIGEKGLRKAIGNLVGDNYDCGVCKKETYHIFTGKGENSVAFYECTTCGTSSVR